MRAIVVTSLLLAATAGMAQQLVFNPSAGVEQTLVMPDGHKVNYIAYEDIPYVTSPEAPDIQTLNFYIPKNKVNDKKTPILLRNYVGAYMEAPARQPSPTDATGRALREGMAVCIPGVRGSNTVSAAGKYVGTAPAAILDLKAAVRYLHYNDMLMPGDANRIISDGMSAGGALSALLGVSGDNQEFQSALQAMGAAPASDAIYASVCYCPITDLNHADMEYEWLFGFMDNGLRNLDPAQTVVSQELSSRCPLYINSLHMTTPDGTPLTSITYREYLRKLLMASAQRALENGCPIPDSIGVSIYVQRTVFPGTPQYVNPPLAPVNPPLMPPPGGPGPGAPGPMTPPPPPPQPILVYSPPTVVYSDYVSNVDINRYLQYVVSFSGLKTPPAFDKYGVLGQQPSVENMLFADSKGNPMNFTDFSLRQRTGNPYAALAPGLTDRVDKMNPMYFIGTGGSNQAVYYYIRHGALDTSTSFLVPINLATRLYNSGASVDFFLPWNRTHQGDYNLDDLFHWIKQITR